MTLDGTNTWILGPSRGPSVVVDPGPLDEAHLGQVVEAAGEIQAIVLTHRHLDHSEGAARFSELSGAGVRAADPGYAIALGPVDGRLDDGARFEVGDVTVRVLATPGHTSDSISLMVSGPDGTWLLTGDMVLGRGTTVITHPDGDLAAYLASIEALLRAVRDHDVSAILPGHGPVVTDPRGVLTRYRQHRLERLEQVREALRHGDETAAEVVARVYADVDRALWPAAEQSVRAQLDYLQVHP
ncbi:MAG: MBL fold metallo-hydrolase [Microlunatus sp.]|nr:MBL fold metallo-hydrolase [Microlunatus sp.]